MENKYKHLNFAFKNHYILIINFQKIISVEISNIILKMFLKLENHYLFLKNKKLYYNSYQL